MVKRLLEVEGFGVFLTSQVMNQWIILSLNRFIHFYLDAFFPKIHPPQKFQQQKQRKKQLFPRRFGPRNSLAKGMMAKKHNPKVATWPQPKLCEARPSGVKTNIT